MDNYKATYVSMFSRRAFFFKVMEHSIYSIYTLTANTMYTELKNLGQDYFDAKFEGWDHFYILFLYELNLPLIFDCANISFEFATLHE